MNAQYQVVLLGDVDARSDRVRHQISLRLQDLGLDDECIAYFTAAQIESRETRLPSVAVFFGRVGASPNGLDTLIEESLVIIPLVSAVEDATSELPEQLCNINALAASDEEGYGRCASLVLEIFRLLRSERRVFISYRRVDSQPLADRLYNALDQRGFDVFIDTRSVPPAVDVQEQLWHRLADSDVVILIDTPKFRDSRWTTEEMARANATNVQILHLLWPGQAEDPSSSFSHFRQLIAADFQRGRVGRGGLVTANTLASICAEVESLRARAIAARYRYLVDGLCDLARDSGLETSVQPERWISITNNRGRMVGVLPIVGVPTSDRINAVFDAISGKQLPKEDLWFIYDNRGLMETWVGHLDWLDKYLPIRAVRMSEASNPLKEVAT